MTESVIDELIREGVFSRLEMLEGSGLDLKALTALAVRELEQLYQRKKVEQSEGPITAIDLMAKSFPPLPIEWAEEIEPDLQRRPEKLPAYGAWLIGNLIHTIGGRELMDRVFEAFVAPHEGREYGLRHSWLDHRFDNIGDWTA